MNTNPLLFNDRREALNTVVHEGRHAYQAHAERTPGFHPEVEKDHPQAQANRDPSEWRLNERDYKEIDKDGEDAYMRQPVERDAGAFGFGVTRGVYPDYEPSQSRVDHYNAENAQSKYGRLKLSEDSNPSTRL